MKPMRLFYLPNESLEGDQVGPRQAFEQLLDDGRLAAYQAHSYLVERRRHASHEVALVELKAAVTAFAPDVIFWQHVHDGYPLAGEFLAGLKAGSSRPKLVYHEADAYGRYVKRMDHTLRAMLAACDLAVLVGLGDLARLAREAGAPRVMLAPHSCDETRFGRPWQPTGVRRFDALMVANLSCRMRIPGWHLPGGAKRKRLAQLFHRAYAERFAVFGAGQGWAAAPYCQGPIPFDQQEATIRSAWLSVNWGQFDELPMYASDRLAISLAAGVPHITNHQPGYELLFPNARGLYAVTSPGEALDVADMLLSLPREHLIEIGLQGMAYALQHLTARRVYADLITAIGQQLLGPP